MDRRSLLLLLAAAPAARQAFATGAARPGLTFPDDFGAHPAQRTEWWYVTGSLHNGPRQWGFQVTFFRSATGVRAAPGSRFEPSQLILAHAALTDLEGKRLRHDQRIARSGFGIAAALEGDTGVTLRDWRIARVPLAADTALSSYSAQVVSETGSFAFTLQFHATQPPLLQGVGAVSRKGPSPNDFSRYYSEPQLAVSGTLTLDGGAAAVEGRAWLDHEWSDAFLPPQAVGWDWIGMNLDDGSALTAFQLRRADGSTLYAGGSHRRAAEPPRNFEPDEVHFTPQRRWKSGSSGADYPVQWQVDTPAGRHTVSALLDDQELDSRGSTGSIYWEGLSELLDPAGHKVGRGYLEMTGYAAALRL